MNNEFNSENEKNVTQIIIEIIKTAINENLKEKNAIEFNIKKFINFIIYFFNRKNLDIKRSAVKYNKNVYINDMLKKSNEKIINKYLNYKRSSKYRGVSKNGNGWQALMLCKNNKSYLGTFYSEELAARIYDFESIRKKGIYAKTNFSYNQEQIDKILNLNSDYKNQNLTKFITELKKLK